ncbi:MAG: FtsW/RodA/SpoVE family cell cycle protein [Paramuribaculum sp.]|nr:FtsW/RodA/SpoVE family cell cycle protein [Paramuribaculum sp.]
MDSLEISPSFSQPAESQTEIKTPVSKPDKHIWGIYILLCMISIIELYSASSREVNMSSALGVFSPIVRHGAMLGIGCLIIYLLQTVHYRKFIPWIPLFMLVSVAMMVYVMFCGEIVNGARRSFSLFGITIQPSEFLKLSSAMMIAWITSKSQQKGGVKNWGVISSAVIVMVFGALLIKQGLTNTLLLMAISLSMMVIGGIEWKKLAVVGLVYMACMGVFFLFSHGREDTQQASGQTAAIEQTDGRSGTWSNRLERFFGDGTPKYEQEIQAENRQEMYSYMAQANGGVFGVFPGNSRETARLPLAFSDYIYAIIIEDMGFIGGIVVLILYLWLLGRASSIASRCSRAFPALLVIGMAVMVVFQALFHMAIVTGFFPVSGQPLPLISKGGTSILITSIAFGIMLSVSRHAVRNGKKQDIKNEIDVLPEDVRADNPTML